MNEQPQGSLTGGLILSFLFLVAIWMVKLVEAGLGADFSIYGLYPRHWDHLYGILTMPFLHGGWDHIVANSIPLVVLTLLLYNGYPHLFFRVTGWVVLGGGLGTWIIGSENYHVGASGVIYGYASFLFCAGILSRHFRMMALAAVVVYLYGQLFWGMFPLMPQTSWEGHLCGALAGLTAALVYRRLLPRRKRYDWEEEQDDEEEKPEEPLAENDPPKDNYLINYYYKEVNKEDDKH